MLAGHSVRFRRQQPGNRGQLSAPSAHLVSWREILVLAATTRRQGFISPQGLWPALRFMAFHSSASQMATRADTGSESKEFCLQTIGFFGEKWCPEADLNHRHADFQSAALPTELSGHPGGFRLEIRGALGFAPEASGVITSCKNVSTPLGGFLREK